MKKGTAKSRDRSARGWWRQAAAGSREEKEEKPWLQRLSFRRPASVTAWPQGRELGKLHGTQITPSPCPALFTTLE